MTKAEIISFVYNNLPKIDKTNKYHPAVLEKAITLAFNQGYSEVFDRDPRLLDNYTKTFSPVIIAADGETGVVTGTLPAVYVPFKDKNSGVRNITTIIQSSTKFFPLSKREFNMFENTLVGEMNANDPIVGYAVRTETVEFQGAPATVISAGVRMDIVVQFDQYADADVVLIPFAKDLQLVGAVLETLKQIPQVDLKDNNADTE